MEKRTKVIITFAFMVLLVFGLYFFSEWFSKTTGYLVENEEEEISLAKCLSEKGFILYTTNNCPDCKIQKDILGNGIRYIKNEVCYSGKKECKDLKAVPAWKRADEIFYGLKSIKDLMKISGCK